MIGKFRKILIFLLIFVWIFSGWPPIWQNPRIPPKIEQVRAIAPDGVIVAWPGTAASIPAGWSRVTRL